MTTVEPDKACDVLIGNYSFELDKTPYIHQGLVQPSNNVLTFDMGQLTDFHLSITFGTVYWYTSKITGPVQHLNY